MKPASSNSNPRAAWMRRTDLLLIALALLGIGFHALSEATRQLQPQPHIDDKMAAASRAQRCFDAIREARVGAPSTLDAENDPEASGLIGQEFTLITTDRGVLESKLTSVNPNFAAVFVRYFHDLQLKPGDAVGVGMTGSFPALNVCLIAAADQMKLHPVVITSIGASMWGANDPTFTWLDMEKLLYDRGLISVRSAAASLGGSNDRGRGLSPKGRALLREAISRNGMPAIVLPTLEQSVQTRIAIFDSLAAPFGGLKAYVNIGGSSASIGSTQSANLIPPGVNRRLKPYNWAQRGVLHHYAKNRVPVVHVLNIESIAGVYGLPLAPETVPPVGDGEIFHREAYDLRVTIPILAVYLVLCFGVLRARNRAAKAAREVAAPLPVPGMGGEPVGERSGG